MKRNRKAAQALRVVAERYERHLAGEHVGCCVWRFICVDLDTVARLFPEHAEGAAAAKQEVLAHVNQHYRDEGRLAAPQDEDDKEDESSSMRAFQLSNEDKENYTVRALFCYLLAEALS